MTRLALRVLGMSSVLVVAMAAGCGSSNDSDLYGGASDGAAGTAATAGYAGVSGNSSGGSGGNGGNGGGSTGGTGATGSGGSSGTGASGCSTAPDCTACQGCFSDCVCNYGTPDVCLTQCNGAGGVGGNSGSSGTGANGGVGGNAGNSGSGGTSASGGVGGSSGNSGSGGSGGSVLVPCSSTPCPGKGFTPGCCSVNNHCGLNVSGFGCVEPGGPGTLDQNCPDIDFGYGAVDPGCCRTDHTCGAMDQFLGLGCVDTAQFGTPGGPC